MDHHAFRKALEELRGCQFRYLRESQKIEDLVQSYLESPKLHRSDYTDQLLCHLLNSEHLPLQRFTKTGLQPSGFLVRTFPRVGPWMVYTGFVAIWVFSVLYALFSRGAILHTIGVWILVGMITGYAAYYVRGWRRLKAITDEMQALMDREIQPGRYDPAVLGNRLVELRRRGLKVHPNVFSLLQLQYQLKHAPAGADHPVGGSSAES